MTEDALHELFLALLRGRRRPDDERSNEEPGTSRSRGREDKREMLLGLRGHMRDEYNRGRNRHEYMDEDDYEREMYHQFRRGPRDYYGRRDDESPEKYSEAMPPLKPQFRLRDGEEGYEYTNIMLLFERHAAGLRNRGVTIFIRAPKCCGQNNLGSMLIQKEKSVGNPTGKHLSSKDSYRNRREMFMMERTHEKVFNNYRELVREQKHNFIVVEIESCISEFKKFREVAKSGKYNVFLIELMQPDDIVKRYAKNKKDDSEALQEIAEMKVPPPKDVELLDAGPLYERDRLLDRVNSCIDRQLYRNNYSISAHRHYATRADLGPNPLRNITLPDPEHKSQIRDALTKPDFIELMKSNFLNLKIDPRELELEDEEPSEAFIQLIKKTRDCNPRLQTDYSHENESDQYDEVKYFRPDKIYDYGHMTTENMFERYSRVDIDKIVKKASQNENCSEEDSNIME